MQVYLRKKKLSDSRQSLYLDIYKDGQRKYEFLQLYIKKGSPDNKETLSFAQQIRDARYKELITDEYGFVSSQKKKASFIKYFENFVETKPKWSNYAGALKHLKKYAGQQDILFKQINKTWLTEVAEYLSKKAGLKKNTAFIYFRKIKEVIYNASHKGFIKADIARQVKNLPREMVEREYLELDEIQKLANTTLDRPEIKRAFLFSCFTGLRQSDVRNLTWKDIQDNKIKIKQQKTKGSISNPLPQTALDILKLDNLLPLPDTKIFNIPTDRSTINRALKRWFKKAEVKKKAFYHISRHTYATLNLTFGNDIYTVSKLLGHKSLKTTEIYAKIIDEKKEQAANNLPKVEVSL